jgi:hypothetical protein
VEPRLAQVGSPDPSAKPPMPPTSISATTTSGVSATRMMKNWLTSL